MEGPLNCFLVMVGKMDNSIAAKLTAIYKLGERSAPKHFGTHLKRILLCKTEADNLKPVLANSFAPSLT